MTQSDPASPDEPQSQPEPQPEPQSEPQPVPKPGPQTAGPQTAGPQSPGTPAVTYPGAPETVIARWMTRRIPVRYGRGESLPPADFDLVPLVTEIVPPDEPRPVGRLSPYRRKFWQLQREFAGLSELALLNADLIVNLRREAWPEHAPALFVRLWREQGAALIQTLPGRWLISSVITFGDFGETEAQRRIGLALNVLFSTMKLYETERTFSGFPPTAVFRRTRMCSHKLPLGMSPFGFHRGGLDFNLLAPIWKDALAEPTVGPLACHLLDRLNADPGNVFRRIRQMSTVRRVPLEPAPGALTEPGPSGSGEDEA